MRDHFGWSASNRRTLFIFGMQGQRQKVCMTCEGEEGGKGWGGGAAVSEKSTGEAGKRESKKSWQETTREKTSCPSAVVFSAGFSIEGSDTELAVKTNQDTINLQPTFICPNCKEPYW